MGGEEMVVRDEPRRGANARVARDSYSAKAIATAALANTPTIKIAQTYLVRIPVCGK